MGIFDRIDRGTYVWIPYNGNLKIAVVKALRDLKATFGSHHILIEMVASHQLYELHLNG
jgi:hypothetical protein